MDQTFPLLFFFCAKASDQKLDGGQAWEQGYTYTVYTSHQLYNLTTLNLTMGINLLKIGPPSKISPPLFLNDEVVAKGLLSQKYAHLFMLQYMLLCNYVKQEAPEEGLTNEGRLHSLLLCKQAHDKEASQNHKQEPENKANINVSLNVSLVLRLSPRPDEK